MKRLSRIVICALAVIALVAVCLCIDRLGRQRDSAIHLKVYDATVIVQDDEEHSYPIRGSVFRGHAIDRGTRSVDEDDRHFVVVTFIGDDRETFFYSPLAPDGTAIGSVELRPGKNSYVIHPKPNHTVQPTAARSAASGG